MHLPHILPFSKAPLYFFTATCAQRKNILARREVRDLLDEIWRNSAGKDGWFVGRYMIMPDHVHFFASPAAEAKTRAAWCKMWKSVSSRRITKLTGISTPIWQCDTFDHILRSSESYSQKWEYVVANPVRAGLALRNEEWPWQGEIFSLSGGDLRL